MSEASTQGKSSTADAPLIYVVDDQEMILMVVEELLRMQHYRTQCFQNPELALEAFLAAEPKPDLLLTDYVMEQMNGMDLIEQCKSACPTLKTILYSGSVGPDIMADARFKPDQFLGKPFKPPALIEMVRSVLAA